ncbi:RNA polymerase epsilon subunit [Lactococcus termiticola]|uniref:DNA-directed RNA polymerase subunit epsilon n=1 Tax=Lactococcus termiticola TaxID=2169526 RepID=A0A2R5HDG1_9LACT|nr:RNA polymerase epsilon subunit [Lactococcus termiticola]GBG96109.1 hypothetical protein NtB2_00213 [Lactococcus termiticola]
MIFKVFYQEDKSRSPRRETTKSLYLDLDVKTEEDGVIKGRAILAEKTDYLVEFIEALSDEAFDYEKENSEAKITEL